MSHLHKQYLKKDAILIKVFRRINSRRLRKKISISYEKNITHIYVFYY